MSAFRPLAPGAMDESSASSSSPSGFASYKESTGATSQSTGGGDDPGKGGGAPNRRRRAAGSVSQKACNRCRTARQKCDGHEPDPCSKCRQHGVTCVWQPHTKESKDELIHQILALQERNREMLAQSAKNEEERKEFQQTTEWQATILRTIGSNGHDQEIIDRLRDGQTTQVIADWLAGEDPSFRNLGAESAVRLTLREVVKMFEEQCQAYDGLRDQESEYSSKRSWTSVTLDHKLIGHLFDLYFTWVHPVHMLFSKQEFAEEFRQHIEGDKDPVYCDSALVNAICAMACHLLDNNKFHRADQVPNAARLREAFLTQAKSGLTPDSYERITSVQTFALLYLVDWSSGKARHGLAYLRTAAEFLRPSYEGASVNSVEITYWGVKTLVTASIGTTYEVIHTSSVPPSEGTLGNVDVASEDENEWGFYRQPGDEKAMPTSEKHGMTTAYHRANLFRLANRILQLYCGLEGNVRADSIIELYKDLMSWKEELPDALQVDDDDVNPLPHIWSLHIQLNAIVVQLLNPLAQSTLFRGPNLQKIQDSIAFHAQRGLHQVEEVQKLYTARFFMPALSFCVVHLADAVMVYRPGRGSDALCVALKALQNNRSGFDVCGTLQFLLWQRAQSLNITAPAEIEWIIRDLPQYGLEEVLDACTRPMYTQPMSKIKASLDPGIAKEWAISDATRALRRSASPADKMQIDSLLNQ